jgi:hypothetical protein
MDLVINLGYKLAMSGAETFRVEESINLILKAYGLEAEAFAIPNCLHVSIKTEGGKPMTRMRRIGDHGNDLDAVERYCCNFSGAGGGGMLGAWRIRDIGLAVDSAGKFCGQFCSIGGSCVCVCVDRLRGRGSGETPGAG